MGTVSLSSGMPRTASLNATWEAARSANAAALASEVMGRIPPPVATWPAALARRSDHDRLALLPEDAAQHVADLAEGDVALHALDEHGHQVGFRPGRLVQPLQHLLRPAAVPLGADALQALHLALDDLLAHTQDLRPRLLVVGELVHADDGPLPPVDLHLDAVGVLLDLALLEPQLDRPQRPAHRVDLRDILERLLLNAIGQALDVVRPGQRVDHVRHAALVGDDLLRPQGDLDRLLGGQGQRLVHRVRVQRLRPAQD